MSKKTEELPFEILKCNERDDITKCVSIVKNGGVIVFPTDTLYGLGCNPYNKKAVEKIFEIKNRDKMNPLPILASSIIDIERIVSLGSTGKKLAEIYWPGALTIIVPLIDQKISNNLRAGEMNIGVRIPNNICALSLLKGCKYLTGTSANKSGEQACKSACEVLSSSLRGFNVILDGGTVEGKIQSTIVDLTGHHPKIIREGAIISEAIYTTLERDSRVY
jgi:L-threonylcarbamoyladenylate synthase